MTEPVPYIDLFGLVAIQKRRGPGWAVGRPGLRLRAGSPSLTLRDIRYVGDVASAMRHAREALPKVSRRELRSTTLDPRQRAAARLLAALAEEVLASLPEIVTLARLSGGLTQGGLAVRAGTYQGTVSKIERGDGDPSFAMIRRLLRSVPG